MKQKIVYKNKFTLSYTDFGDKNGFPVLVQHGLIASIVNSDIFEQLIRIGARVICMARPGYGESSPYSLKNYVEWAEIASVLIEELNLSRFDVFGISSGAPYSYSLGFRFPDRARKLFILSGMPALYDKQVLTGWPYPVTRNSNIAEMEKLAGELFFSNLSQTDMEQDDIKDSMMNEKFGVAQDLLLRGMDWGFKLSDVKQEVYMRHSRLDPSVPISTAEITARLLPRCHLEISEHEAHFSQEVCSDFITSMMADHY